LQAFVFELLDGHGNDPAGNGHAGDLINQAPENGPKDVLAEKINSVFASWHTELQPMK
jgi:hypothetical protein